MDKINKYIKEFNNLDDEKYSQFEKYFEYLIEENKKINLTSITDKKEVYIKHFLDSIKLSNFIDLDNKNICDIGAGAGFPSIPLKILYPSISLTIIEPTGKRCKFLKELSNLLGLKSVTIINDRAENIGKSVREQFDIVTARAVSNMKILSELCLPLVKLNGYFVPLKGKNIDDEFNNAKDIIKLLGGKLIKIVNYDLPEDMGERCVVIIEKVKKTPTRYPRNYSIIKKER